MGRTCSSGGPTPLDPLDPPVFDAMGGRRWQKQRRLVLSPRLLLLLSLDCLILTEGFANIRYKVKVSDVLMTSITPCMMVMTSNEDIFY